MRFAPSIAGLLFAVLLVPVTFAQSGSLAGGSAQLVAVISGPNDIAVGRTLVLDASSSTGTNDDTQYRWYRDGIPQPISRSLEAVFTPEKPGTTVIRLVLQNTVNGETVEIETQHVIIVFDRKIILVADSMVPAEKIAIHQQNAKEQGIYLRVLQSKAAAIPLGDDGSLLALLTEEADTMAGAESIAIWTDGISGLQTLLRAIEGDEDRLNAIKNQTIVLITDRGLNTLVRTARGPFSVLRPNKIIVTRKEAMNPLLLAEDVADFQVELEQRDIDFAVLDESSAAVRPWNLLSSLVNYMLTHGVSSQTIILLLTLPLIATVLAFLKQVVGITTFGLFTPSIIALSFIALGWKVGVLFLLFIIISGYATRSLMRRWRLLYIPKVAIILTVVSMTLLIMLGIGAYFGLTLSGDTIFVLLIMSTLSESFLNVKKEEGLYSAIIGIAETVLAALLCVFIVQWSVLQSMVLAYPELILITLFINIFLGRWTGLRLVEYFRFREVFKQLQEE